MDTQGIYRYDWSINRIDTSPPRPMSNPKGASPEVAYWDSEPAARKLVLNCFHVCTLNTSESRGEIRPTVETLLAVCRRATLNIGSKRVEENLYEWPNESITVYGGSGSVKHFRDNALKRIAEAFVNFAWILDNNPSNFNLDEFKVYEKFFVELTRFDITRALGVANESYINARALVDRHFCGPI